MTAWCSLIVGYKRQKSSLVKNGRLREGKLPELAPEVSHKSFSGKKPLHDPEKIKPVLGYKVFLPIKKTYSQLLICYNTFGRK